ncbi:hypothetical protein K469DRAFT_152150 [Zopfia rhizophila CBS 207.26]|uniref:Rhodopsin domain-containing protein n=1 Tax=Zopfia rhizophila CBS 207.26 TaxID=1314779 RepID=A0A6A6E2E8_9PEZI|nr:hypothetical protein K469DRAFT_152150 [Zopfia rhizophila CBS 207.26]
MGAMFIRRDEVVGLFPPPPGVTPNFANPPSRGHIVITANIVLSFVSTVFMGLRFYTNSFITRKRGVDDYMAVLAWLLLLGYSISCSFITKYGLGRHIWDIPFSVLNPNYMKVSTIAKTFYGTSVMFTKLSILALFLRFIPDGKLRATVHTTMVVIVIYSLLLSFQWVYRCRPLEKHWDLAITRGSCIDWLKINIFSGVMNTITDVTILVLPIPILRNIRIPIRQKIGVMIVLMTGGFVSAISIIRLKMIVDSVGSIDFTWDVCQIVWWSVEVHIAIVCACLPAGKPFFRRHFHKFIGSSYGASVGTRRQTMRSGYAQHPRSRDGDELSLNRFPDGCSDGESSYHI